MFHRRLYTSRRNKAAISSVTFGLFSSASQKPNNFTSTSATATSALPPNSLPPNFHDQCQESQEETVASSMYLKNNQYERWPSEKHTRRFGFGCPSASTQFWQSVLNALRAVLAVFSQVSSGFHLGGYCCLRSLCVRCWRSLWALRWRCGRTLETAKWRTHWCCSLRAFCLREIDSYVKILRAQS